MTIPAVTDFKKKTVPRLNETPTCKKNNPEHLLSVLNADTLNATYPRKYENPSNCVFTYNKNLHQQTRAAGKMPNSWFHIILFFFFKVRES